MRVSRRLTRGLSALAAGGLLDGGFLYFTAANARGADANALTGAFDNGMYALQVQIPTAIRLVICVTDSMAKLRPTAA